MSATVIELGEPMFAGEVHPYADRWPMRTADELEAMAESIRANGLRLPIILSADGVLVDGRNRLRACEIANVPPRFEVREELTDEDSITAFIWDMNGDHRRHMSKGQTAMLAALMPGAVRLVSKHSSVSSAYVGKARTVIDFCDETIIEAVIAGPDSPRGIALDTAYARAQEIKATVQAEEIAERQRRAAEKSEAEKRAARLADLRAHRADLAALVDEGKLPLDDALTIRDKDAAKERQQEAQRVEKIAKLNRDFSTKTHLLAALGEYPDRLAELLAVWAPEQQPYPVTEQMIDNAIAGLNAVAEHIRSNV